MTETPKYFVVRPKALPEVLLKVASAKRLLETGKAESVQDATEMVGISRSSFYKYKDDIFLYVQQYYRYFMKRKSVEELPVFLLHKV